MMMMIIKETMMMMMTAMMMMIRMMMIQYSTHSRPTKALVTCWQATGSSAPPSEDDDDDDDGDDDADDDDYDDDNDNVNGADDDDDDNPTGRRKAYVADRAIDVSGVPTARLGFPVGHYDLELVRALERARRDRYIDAIKAERRERRSHTTKVQTGVRYSGS
jgi:hypothetical protein